MRVVKALTWSSREKKESIQIPDGESYEVIPSIPELDEEEQTFPPPEVIETQKMIPMTLWPEKTANFLNWNSSL